MRTRRTLALAVLLVAVGAVLTGCRGQPSEDAPVVPIRNMYDQPRYDPQQRSEFFSDGRTDRLPVPGAVSQEDEVSLAVLTGLAEDGSGWLAEVPAPVTDRMGGMERLLARGQERFGISCAPCHGLSGDGDGMIASRAQALGAGVLKPPTFHDDRIRTMPDGQMFAIITHGIRNMPPYRHSVAVEDRWAVVAYVRALQVSQAGWTTAMNTVEERP
jgi:mono/diheme cytochrome c family protein